MEVNPDFMTRLRIHETYIPGDFNHFPRIERRMIHADRSYDEVANEVIPCFSIESQRSLAVFRA